MAHVLETVIRGFNWSLLSEPTDENFSLLFEYFLTLPTSDLVGRTEGAQVCSLACKGGLTFPTGKILGLGV